MDDRVLHLPGIGALYLVGDDPLSRAWLTQHAAQLNAMNAAGMVVNVKSETGLQALQALAQEDCSPQLLAPIWLTVFSYHITQF